MNHIKGSQLTAQERLKKKRKEKMLFKNFDKEQKEKCNLCGKDRKGYDGFVWYSGDFNTELCKSCHLKWQKTKECLLLNEKYKKTKPTTKRWYKMCEELQKAFDKWYNAKVDGGRMNKIYNEGA